MSEVKNIVLALDLATSLGERLVGLVAAISQAHAEGRDDISSADLDRFTAADDAASARLKSRIALKRAGG